MDGWNEGLLKNCNFLTIFELVLSFISMNGNGGGAMPLKRSSNFQVASKCFWSGFLSHTHTQSGRAVKCAHTHKNETHFNAKHVLSIKI